MTGKSFVFEAFEARAATQIWICGKTVRERKIFPICDLFAIQRDKFQITRIFLISVDEMMTSKFRKGLTFKTN